MRRVLSGILVTGALIAFAVLALGSGDSSGGHTYWAELDNAFGLTTGGDLKVAGVKVGKISDMKVELNADRPHYAMIKIKIVQTGWGSLRTDASCQTRPQSLIGEYFLDCDPGTAGKELAPGSSTMPSECGPATGCIPVSRTHSTISPDLVNDVLRYPYRTRFSIILNEFGAAVGGNGAQLNDAIRRSVPALQQTDRVLAILAQQNQILADLATNGDRVVSDLAANRADVGRWVLAAGKAATTSAERQADLAAGWRKLPGFLTQFRPALAALGQVADQQTPALRDLGASSGQLKTLFDRLAPFARASTPAFKAFGRAASTGREAVRAATPTVAQLNVAAKSLPELAGNLAIVLEHLDNRAYAVEKDPKSPGGMGYNGLEALLNYVFYQSTSINTFDGVEHLLNTSAFASQECDPLQDAAAVKANPQLAHDCGDYLGPVQPGINAPDPTNPGASPTAVRAQRQAQQRSAAQPAGQRQAQNAPAAPGGVPLAPTPPAAPAPGPGLSLPKLSKLLPGTSLKPPGTPSLPTDVPVPPALKGSVGSGASVPSPSDERRVLDYLLGP
ncbi:MAG: MCE family protein [Actinobacteria bacterium]|nr:MAG: MCE family protein [Actinomycetota bacterium]